ncbi:amino acid deaminase [Pseudonocardia nigra]|uniref:amino acid deaminase n=1 Tax=Pseudonocardia nigra TaxID=1921578 RepID=UPI001C605AAC|nr:amino acid deaminase [Pseudonocardia nigra]
MSDGRRRAALPGPSRLSPDALQRLAAEPVDARFKAFPGSAHLATGLTVGEVGDAGWTVHDLLLPAVTLRESALAHNLERMAAWCAERGASLAPHGKTTMAPQLFDWQLAVGAWGITAATMSQVRLMRAFGVARVLLANEVVDAPSLHWLAAESGRDPDFEFLCLVDSLAAVEAMEAALPGVDAAARPVEVLVELGVPGRRTGARSPADLVALAERVAVSPRLALAGVEGYEGVLHQDREPATVRRAAEFLSGLVDAAVDLDRRGLFNGRAEIVVSAGGSAFFDLVMDAVDGMGATSVPVRPVLRSGGYVTHDHVHYERSSPLRSAAAGPTERFLPALELRARVVSTPEPGLAIAGFGKRDAPYDLDLPVPLAVNGAPIDGTAEAVELNDQHAFLRHDAGLRVGDVVTFGLSHPCTAFDKWSLLPLVDDDDRVIGAVRTFF